MEASASLLPRTCYTTGGTLDLLPLNLRFREGLGRHSAGVCTVAFRATGCSKRSNVMCKKTQLLHATSRSKFRR